MPHTCRVGYHLLIGEPFWVLVSEAIHQRAQQLGVDLVPLTDPLTLPSEEQVRQIEEILNLELQALITNITSFHLLRPVLDANIPIVLISETDWQHPRLTSPQGLFDAAHTAVEYLAQRLHGQGRLLVVGGLLEGNDRGQSRLAGMRAVVQRYPQIEVTHIPTPWGYQRAHEYVSDALPSLGGGFDAVFGLSDPLALAGRDALQAHGLLREDAVVVGINGDPLALAAIVQGRMAATVDTPSAEFGRQIADLACRAAQGDSLPDHFNYRPRLVTADNATEVAMYKLVDMAEVPDRLVNNNRYLERKRMAQLETSLAISQSLGAILDKRQLRHAIAELIRVNYGYDNVQIFLWAGDRHELVLDQPEDEQDEPIRIPLQEAGLLGYTLLRNRPTFVPDMQHSQRFPPDPYWPDTRSRVIVPIRLGGELLGLLDLHSRTPTGQTYEDLLGLQALADQLGVSMRNAQLYGEALAARAEAERADQLKSRLLANVSHELRTPLNVIQGYSQSALAVPSPYGVELPAELRADLGHIYQSSEHLGRLINDLLDLAQAETGSLDILPEPLNPRELVLNVFEIMAGSSRSGDAVEWRLQVPDWLPDVYADPVRLRQILLNLLSNAAKFTSRGHITLGAQGEDDCLHLWVEDTGCGIPPDQQACIFAAFGTAERPRQSHQGIGLGLRITHELVHLHGGHIALESTPGLGTTIHVYLASLTAEQRTAHAMVTAPPVVLPSFADHPDALPPHVSPLTRQAVAFLCEHYAGDLDRGRVAKHLGVTAGYLTRVFHRELGLTPWDYLTRLRIVRAKELLAHASLSIAEVAGRVGYNDPAYFTRVFLKETGHSPRAFRKTLREKSIVSNSPT